MALQRLAACAAILGQPGQASVSVLYRAAKLAAWHERALTLAEEAEPSRDALRCRACCSTWAGCDFGEASALQAGPARRSKACVERAGFLARVLTSGHFIRQGRPLEGNACFS